ncbi:MAG: hypothetical protein KatS3mg032_1884 [Cyclobacteriaceae bacterium]|nr:MAG: hypothetical protein KatS3mg032_1884 [Cyclobacteriaceae bacterium]
MSHSLTGFMLLKGLVTITILVVNIIVIGKQPGRC